MTSLDFPVVPEVGMRTATSAWLTPAPRAGSAAPGASTGWAPAQPWVSSLASRTPGAGLARPASAISGYRPASVIRARGLVWCASPASSAGELRGLAETVTAPIEASASQHSR